MSILDANQLLTQQMVRLFFQFGGPRPDAELQFFGKNAQFAFVSGVTVPFGDINPINMPDPDNSREYTLVQRSTSAPGNKEASLIVHERRGVVPRSLGRPRCQFNLYLPVGPCGNLADPGADWTYIDVLEGCIPTQEDGGTRSVADGDDALGNTYSLVLSDRYKIGPIALGEAAAADISREVIDTCFGQPQPCEGCEPTPDDWIYVLVSDDTGSAGVQAQVLWSNNGGSTFTAASITGIGTNEQVKAVRSFGRYLLVLGTDAYYYATINPYTGAPSAFTKVVTGFAVGGTPSDVYVASPREVYFCGAGGYLYKTSDITSGVRVLRSGGDVTSNNLTRIRGFGDTVVAVGAAGTVVRSVNRGRTWSTVTVAPTADSLSALAVRSSTMITACTSTGYIYETANGGESAWTSTSFPGSGSGKIEDMAYATPSVGYFSHTDASGSAHLYWTWSGGREWYEGPRRVLNTPVADRFNRIAVPGGPAQTAANTVALGGLAGNGTDGIFLLGVAEQL